MASERLRRVVIGVGIAERGDDGAGRAVVQRLSGTLPGDVEIVECEGETTVLLARIEGASAVFVVDACVSGAPPGTIRRFDATEAPLPDLGASVSTHDLGLAAAIELARALGELPPRCIVYTIEGCSFEAGAPLSPPVRRAVAEVARRLRADVAR